MKKIIIQLLSCFIPSRQKRHEFRHRYLKQTKKSTLKLNNNDIKIHPDDVDRVHFFITGEHNTIVINKLKKSSGIISIHLAGNNCHICLEEDLFVESSLDIVMGQEHPNFGLIESATLKIGRQSAFMKTQIVTYNSHTKIEIGQNCMFSSNIMLFHTDAHPIYDRKNHKIINKVKDMIIGNHVWVGAGVTILKNTYIPDDCIVGYNSVVSLKYHHPQQDCDRGGWIIAGNPARVVKTGITWDSNGSKGYIQNE